MSTKSSEIDPARGRPTRHQATKPRRRSVEHLTVKKPALNGEGRRAVEFEIKDFAKLTAKQRRRFLAKLRNIQAFDFMGLRLSEATELKAGVSRKTWRYRNTPLSSVHERLAAPHVARATREELRTAPASPLLAAAKERLRALTPGFTDWVGELPPLPEDEFGFGGGDADGPFIAPRQVSPEA